MTSHVPKEVFKDCEVGAVYNFIIFIVCFTYRTVSRFLIKRNNVHLGNGTVLKGSMVRRVYNSYRVY